MVPEYRRRIDTLILTCSTYFEEWGKAFGMQEIKKLKNRIIIQKKLFFDYLSLGFEYPITTITMEYIVYI